MSESFVCDRWKFLEAAGSSGATVSFVCYVSKFLKAARGSRDVNKLRKGLVEVS